MMVAASSDGQSYQESSIDKITIIEFDYLPKPGLYLDGEHFECVPEINFRHLQDISYGVAEDLVNDVLRLAHMVRKQSPHCKVLQVINHSAITFNSFPPVRSL